MTGGVNTKVYVDPRTCCGVQETEPAVTAVIVLKFALQVDSMRKLSFFKFQVLRRIEVVWEGVFVPLHMLAAASSNGTDFTSVVNVVSIKMPCVCVVVELPYLMLVSLASL